MACCGRPDPQPVQPKLPPRAMNFAFIMVETIVKRPAEFFTIMECLRLGGHGVVILSAQEDPLPSTLPLGFDFSHFQVETLTKDQHLSYCRDNNICMLFDDGFFKYP
jgi:hypothetical protein